MNTTVQTGWVVPPPPIRGLDHLGVLAPCINLYGHLLPGITNVTDRARYYSFHPWLVWSFEKRYSDHSHSAFIRVLRRAECLSTLIGAYHALELDEDHRDHGISMVGREKLVDAAAALRDGGSVDLGEFADLDGPSRYFKNQLGGLGQYYFGPLRDLRILEYVDQNPKNPPGYDRMRGIPIAEAFDASVDGGDAFFNAIESKQVSRRQLDRLLAFCPCGLRSSRTERDLLLDLFLARQDAHQAPEASWRRDSLMLLLNLIRESPRPTGVELEGMLRAASYSGAFQDGSPWVVPASVSRVRDAWGTYQRNELLSVSIQGLFWATLHAVALEHRGRVGSAHELGAVARGLAQRAIGAESLSLTVTAFVDSIRANLPPPALWNESGHEIKQAWDLIEAARATNPHLEGVLNVFRRSIELLTALLARGVEPEPYARFEDAVLDDEDIHLQSLRAWGTRWSEWTVESWVTWLATHWGILRHLQVALRKLRVENRDTFRVRPLDGELRLVEVPPVVFTSPRLSCTQQILRDLGLLEATDDWWKLTDLGRRNLEAFLAG